MEGQDKHGQSYKRNSAHAKKYYEPAEGRDEEDDIENFTEEEVPQRAPQPEETPPQQQLEQATQQHSQLQQPIPVHTPPRRRPARKTKPPERFGY